MPIGSVRPMNEPPMTPRIRSPRERAAPARRLLRRPWPRAFSHPLYWAALALLLLNDHVLKGGGYPFAPPWLTGKLSDFAGLIVAPPLVALLALGAFGGRAARAAAIAAPVLVGAGFAAIKLDAGAAGAAEELFRALGVASRIWVDPTDLYALAVLPIAWALCRPAPARAALPVRAAWRTPIVVTAAFACIATTGGDEEKGGASDIPELLNETEEALIVHIASTHGAGGCPLYTAQHIGALTPEAFALRREVVVAKGGRASLTGDLSVKRELKCGAAWITLPDGREQLVYWSGLEPIESFVGGEDAKRVARRVILRGQTNRFRFEVGDDLKGFELGGNAPTTNCMGRVPAHTAEATALSLAPGFYELGSVTTDDDECLVVEWVEQSSQPEIDTQRLCIPEWAFPFEAGEKLSVIEEFRQNGARRLRVTRFNDNNRINQRLTIWNHTEDLWGAHAKKLLAEDCVGAITACGAYTRPAQVELRGRDGIIVPGDEADLKEGNDEIRMLIGEGREVGWTTAACTGHEARAGLSVNLLELRTD